jgi:hypothetical protein
MKNKLMIMAGAVAALVSIGSVAQATPITGSVGFTGTYTQNGGTFGDLTTANSMTINTTTIGTTSGSFVGATLVSFASPINVNPATGLTTLWSVLVGSTTYKFTSTSESQNLTTPTGLHLLGTGVITDGNAADTTTGTWQLGFGVSGDSFQWQSTAAANKVVPDSGSTSMLLGAALSSLCLFKKKEKA